MVLAVNSLFAMSWECPKAALPFLAGAVGGMAGGCAWGGNGLYFML